MVRATHQGNYAGRWPVCRNKSINLEPMRSALDHVGRSVCCSGQTRCGGAAHTTNTPPLTQVTNAMSEGGWETPTPSGSHFTRSEQTPEPRGAESSPELAAGRGQPRSRRSNTPVSRRSTPRIHPAAEAGGRCVSLVFCAVLYVCAGLWQYDETGR